MIALIVPTEKSWASSGLCDDERHTCRSSCSVSVFLRSQPSVRYTTSPAKWERTNASRCVSFLPPDLDESFGGLSDFDLRWESWTFSVILMSSDLGSRECSESVLKIESGPLPAITSRHSELSSHSTPGHRMPSRA